MYTTVNFYLCAYLLSTGMALTDHWKDGHQTVFGFDESAELDQRIQEYFSMQARVEPIAYGNAVRNLKSIIHADHTA